MQGISKIGVVLSIVLKQLIPLDQQAVEFNLVLLQHRLQRRRGLPLHLGLLNKPHDIHRFTAHQPATHRRIPTTHPLQPRPEHRLLLRQDRLHIPHETLFQRLPLRLELLHLRAHVLPDAHIPRLAELLPRRIRNFAHPLGQHIKLRLESLQQSRRRLALIRRQRKKIPVPLQVPRRDRCIKHLPEPTAAHHPRLRPCGWRRNRQHQHRGRHTPGNHHPNRPVSLAHRKPQPPIGPTKAQL